MEHLVVFLFGLALGSFANVCIYRIPRGMSVVKPGSACPECGERIRWYDNIPLISYLLLRGRCRYCGERISPRYPVVELLVGIIALSLFEKFGFSISALYYMLLSWVLVVVSFIDLEHLLVPVELCHFTMTGGILLSPFVPGISFVDSILGASFGAGIVLFIADTYRILTGKEGMGSGDANVLALMGAFVGWRKVLIVLFLASVVGAVAGTVYAILGRKGFKAEIPFAPFLSIGGYLTFMFGDTLARIYGGIF